MILRWIVRKAIQMANPFRSKEKTNEKKTERTSYQRFVTYQEYQQALSNIKFYKRILLVSQPIVVMLATFLTYQYVENKWIFHPAVFLPMSALLLWKHFTARAKIFSLDKVCQVWRSQPTTIDLVKELKCFKCGELQKYEIGLTDVSHHSSDREWNCHIIRI